MTLRQAQVIDATHTFTVTRYYDGLGRQYLTNTNGILVNSTFDAYGRAVTQSTPHVSGETSYNTVTTFDALGRPDLVTAPDGTQIDYTYNGLETKVKDANNHETITLTNILGRTLSVTPPTGPAVSFTYDALGNMLTASRGGATVTLAYDNAGRKLSMNDPDMGNWSYSYDALGLMTSQVDARSCTTNLQYDLLGRPTQKSYSGCPSTATVSYGYDSGTNGVGRRTSMTDASGSASWYYDSRGRLVKETKIISGSSFVTEWGYNSADLPTWMKYPDGEIVANTYDNSMLLKSVDGNDTYIFDTQYDSAGRMTSRLLGNGLTQNYGYYDWNEKVNNVGQGGRLETLTTGSLQNLSYVYDSVGNVKQITNSIASETNTYQYDSLNRLTSWTLNGQTENYAYDSATGNLSNKAGLALDYPANGTRPHAVTGASGNGVSNTYDYDANGNQTTRNIGGSVYQLEYDAENRVVSVTGPSLTAQFTFDGDGRRVMSVVNGETILFVGGHFEVNDNTNEVTKYYFAGAGRIAMRQYVVPQTTSLKYLLGDHLGSTSMVTDEIGTLLVETRYKPWGEVRYTTPNQTLPTRYTFTGQYSYVSDDATDLGAAGFGLMFYNARWYDHTTGRFAQADSIVPGGVQGLDRYAYTANNPVRYVDPSGHEEKHPGDDSHPFGSGSVLQVHYDVNQYQPSITGTFDPQTGLWSNFGYMACGLVMGSYAGADVQAIGNAAWSHGYTTEGGIQPSGLEATFKDVYGSGNVKAFSSNNAADALNDMFVALQNGDLVGVDILVSQETQKPSPFGTTFAHFTRVVGIDFENGTITLSDSLGRDGDGSDVWVMSLEDFVLVWYNPELRAVLQPGDAEYVEFWYIIVEADIDCENETCAE